MLRSNGWHHHRSVKALLPSKPRHCWTEKQLIFYRATPSVHGMAQCLSVCLSPTSQNSMKTAVLVERVSSMASTYPRSSQHVNSARQRWTMVYRIMFGMVRLNSNEFLTLRNQPHLRGHKYVTNINKRRCSNNRRNNFFSIRIVNLWNNLPSSTTDFTSFRKFDKSLNNDYLLLYCKLNFT